MQFNESDQQRLRLIIQLMARRKAGQRLEPAEEVQLNEWLSRSDLHQQAYDDFVDDERLLQDAATFQELDDIYRSKNSDRIKPHKVRVLPLLVKIVAMAAVVSGLALLGIFIWKKQPSQGNPGTAPNASTLHDALPGSQQATLQRANGQRYELSQQRTDSLGTWAGQSVATAAGQLVYTPIASNTANTDLEDLNTVTTPNGGGYQVQLSDGSVVQLNAGSSVTFPTTFNKQQRNITVQGEALLTVAKRTDGEGKHIPFIVQAGDVQIAVLGTQFNINTYGDRYRAKTTLLEGRIVISGPQQQQVAMVPGQRALLQPAGALRIETLQDPLSDIAWTKNLFYFKDMPFEEMMQQLSRWYNITVKYEGAIPAFKGGGYIQRNIRLSELLRQLSFTLHDAVSFEINDRVLLVKQQQPK